MASVCPIIYRFKVQWYQGPKHLYSDSPPLFLKVKTANFKGLFTSENAIGCYFQWNACTHFQKICSWTRYECSNVNRKTSTTLAELFRFCFQVIFWRFLPLKNPLVATFSETCVLSSSKYGVEQGLKDLKSSEKHKLLQSHSSVFT